jgi:hypothetical protein
MEDKQTLRPPYPIPNVLTVVPPVDEPQSNCQAEEAVENADESDESTGQVELKKGNHACQSWLQHQLRPSRGFEVREQSVN